MRQLWFLDGTGEAHLQTEVVCEPAASGAYEPAGLCTMDVAASLKRTPYLGCMARRLIETRPRRVLMLGLGGGLLPTALSSSGAAEVLVVERSALVLDLARRFFGVPGDGAVPGFSVELCDAEEFVHGRAASAEPFDACAIDVWDSHSYRLPDFVLSAPFHAALRAALRPGARMVQNALAHSGHLVRLSEGPRIPQGEVSRCYVRCRGAAPRGPLRPGVFLRHNEAGKQLALLADVFREAYGTAIVHNPCPWVPSRVVEADID